MSIFPLQVSDYFVLFFFLLLLFFQFILVIILHTVRTKAEHGKVIYFQFLGNLYSVNFKLQTIAHTGAYVDAPYD